MSDDKTEEPTQKKLRDARRDGQVSKSSDMVDAVSMAAAVMVVVSSASSYSQTLHEIVNVAIQFVGGDHSLTNMTQQTYKIGALALTIILPCVLAAALGAIVASIGQVGFQITTKPVSPNLESVSPVAGIKRIFTIKSLIEIAKMIVKASVVFIVMWVTIRQMVPLIADGLYQPLHELSVVFWEMLHKLLIVSVAVLIITSAADIKLQGIMFMKNMMMSKDEVKREYKDSEGDPHLKGERRRLAQEMVNEPPPQKVGLANMMLVNPTHYAVAVRYAPDEHPLPRVIAKGMDEHAAVLRREARDAGVPIIGNPPVARALYKVGLNQPIPEELFETVAAILRWVEAIGARRDPASPEFIEDAGYPAAPPTLH
jgi:type III secretion protein U